MPHDKVVQMSSQNEQNVVSDANTDRELNLLAEIQLRPEATQRQLSVKLGIALGMTNLLLHNLAEKGYVRITNAGWRRFIYNLTPEGISRKIHLTLDYVHRFLEHYSRVRQTLREELAQESLNAESRIAIYGKGEFAELVYLGLKELGIEEMEVFVSGAEQDEKFLGIRVKDASTLEPDHFDRVVIATPGRAETQYQTLIDQGVGREKLVLFFTPAESQTDKVAHSKNGLNGRRKSKK